MSVPIVLKVKYGGSMWMSFLLASQMEIDTTIAASVPLKKRFGISEAPMVLVFVDGQLQARLGPDLNPEMIMDAVVPE